VTDRLDEALEEAVLALVRQPARRDLRARVFARLAGTPTPARPRWVMAAVLGALVVVVPLAWRVLHGVPTPAIVAVASPPARRAAAPAVGARPVSAAREAIPVVPTRPVAARPPIETEAATTMTDLAVTPLGAPAAIRIEPIEAEGSAIKSLASDPLVIPPLDAEGVPGQEERP